MPFFRPSRNRTAGLAHIRNSLNNHSFDSGACGIDLADLARQISQERYALLYDFMAKYALKVGTFRKIVREKTFIVKLYHFLLYSILFYTVLITLRIEYIGRLTKIEFAIYVKLNFFILGILL